MEDLRLRRLRDLLKEATELRDNASVLLRELSEKLHEGTVKANERPIERRRYNRRRNDRRP